MLIVEKKGKKFDVKPIVVDNVLKEEMEIFDKLPKPVESDDTETCIIDIFVLITVDSEDTDICNAEILDPNTVEYVNNAKLFKEITVLNVEIVESCWVFSVDILEPIIVEYVDNPICKLSLFKEITVLNVEIVERCWVSRLDIFEPIVVEYVERADCNVK